MKAWGIIAALGCLLGCAAPENSIEADYRTVASATLWLQQDSTSSAMTLAMVETELARRGESHAGGAYLGKRTAAAYGQRLYARHSAAVLTGKQCSDFPSSAAAQQFFLRSGGPTQDRYNLDGDGDGLACEWGVTLRTSRKLYAHSTPRTVKSSPKYRSAPRYSSGCYTGPRGGRYTISASGRKNYGGC